MQSREWTAGEGEPLTIPEVWVKPIKYEIMVLSSKKLMTFQCASYHLEGQVCRFTGVLLDTSERNARGRTILQRVSYHDEVVLGNTGFMVIPIPQEAVEELGSSTSQPPSS